jgi:hypothetical protein
MFFKEDIFMKKSPGFVPSFTGQALYKLAAASCVQEAFGPAFDYSKKILVNSPGQTQIEVEAIVLKTTENKVHLSEMHCLSSVRALQGSIPVVVLLDPARHDRFIPVGRMTLGNGSR